jgi:cytochrome bd-type quinol oxidase subunit 2
MPVVIGYQVWVYRVFRRKADTYGPIAGEPY